MKKQKDKAKGGLKAYDVVLFVQTRATVWRVHATNKTTAMAYALDVLIHDATNEFDIIRVEETAEEPPF